MPSRHASSLAPRGAGRHTPDPALAGRAWVLHPPRPRSSRGPCGTSPCPTAPAGSARPENRLLGRPGPGPAGKVRAAGRAAAGRREGHVPSQPRRTRPPTGRRPAADRSEGFREPVSAPALVSAYARPSGPASSGSPPLRRARARARRPLRASVRPASAPRTRRPPQRTGKGRAPTARCPASSSSFQPRPPRNPSRPRQVPARARSSPATRPGPQRTARTGCVHRK